MSKGHKKRYQTTAAFSTSTEKPSPVTSKPEEPIKLERVLLSDDFYWEVPGDVPASNRRFGMKMVPPGIEKDSDTSKMSIPPSSMINNTEEVDIHSKLDTRSVAETKEQVDTAIQARNNTSSQVDTITSAPLFVENKASVDTTSQVQKDTVDSTEESSNKTVASIKPVFVDSNVNKDVITAPTPNSKVAATILPRKDTTRADTDRFDTTLKSEQAATVAEAKDDYSFQQTVIANKKIEQEEIAPSKLRHSAENDKSTDRRINRAWFILPLLLLLAGVLYDALSNKENVLAPVNDINTNEIANTSVSDQAFVADDAVVANTEVSQVKPVFFITHVVVKGDTLWDISQKYLNDPFRYPELAELSNIKNPDLIYPGEIITIATTQAVDNNVQAQVFDKSVVANLETSQLKPIGFITHVVVKGDTLWDISKKYLNNPFRYPEVAKLSEIKNPDLIYPGDIVRIQIEN